MIDVAKLKDEYSKKSVVLRNEKSVNSRDMNIKPFVLIPSFLFTPTLVFAEEIGDGTTFSNIYDVTMRLFDNATVIVIIFSAATWMLGHRSRAIESLIGACCAYVLARHAVDIRDFLKGI